MKSNVLGTFACLLAAMAAPALAQTPVRFTDLDGWWSADPVFGGEPSHLALQFIEKDGKPEGRLWLMAIGAYDIPLGELKTYGNSIDFKESFPLTWNPTTQTLTGVIPADAAPVYNIPIEFRRGAPVEKPKQIDWQKSAPHPHILWTLETGAPVWAGLERDPKSRLLFVANEAGDVNAIDGEGKVRWKFATGKPIRSQPKVWGKTVYVASDSGFLYALDVKSGKEQWRATVDTTLAPRLPSNDPKTRWDRYGSSVMSDGRHLYIASRDKNLYALNMDGREAWHIAADDIMTATPALHAGNVIFADYAGKVRAASAKDGKILWTYDAKLAVPGDVVVAENRVLIGSRSYDLIALDAATGKELWKRYYWFSWIESPPVVRDGVIYTGSSDATNVYAVNLSDGTFRWKTAVPGYSWQRIAMANDRLITGTLGRGAYPASRNGSLIAIDLHSGGILWSYVDPPSEEAVKSGRNWGFAASPIVADEVVYAADFNGRVYAFEQEALTASASTTDDEAVRATIGHYFRGHATGDAANFRKAFLPSAHIEGNRDGKFTSWTLEDYCALFKGPAPDEASRVRTIDLVDVSGDAAIAKATLDHGARVFTDYFVLLKVDGEWRIANKVYFGRKK